MEAQVAAGTAPRPGLVLAVLAVGGSAYAMLQSLVVPALPTLQQDLDTTPTGVAWIFTTYLLAASIATPIAGRLGRHVRQEAGAARRARLLAAARRSRASRRRCP